MTPEDKENFYDEEIAPKLLELGQKCQDNDISFFALVEYDPKNRGGYGTTQTRTKDCSITPKMLDYIAQVKGNIDSFFIGIVRYLKENKLPHSSAFLLPYLDPDPEKRK